MRSVPRGWGFRSGVGCRHEDGTQEDWEGLSPNGRQYLSPITGQINDLQGANYWEMRKQLPNKLSVSGELPTENVWTKDGKANIAAFTDEELGIKEKAKSVPIAHAIIPQEKTLNRLDEQELALYKAFNNGEVGADEFQRLLYAIQQKRNRAWKARCKALGIPDDYADTRACSTENAAENRYLVGKTAPKNDDWLYSGNVFILAANKLKQARESLYSFKLEMPKIKLDKDKLAPYIGFALITSLIVATAYL